MGEISRMQLRGNWQRQNKSEPKESGRGEGEEREKSRQAQTESLINADRRQCNAQLPLGRAKCVEVAATWRRFARDVTQVQERQTRETFPGAKWQLHFKDSWQMKCF